MTNQRTYPLRACFLTGILALFVAGCGSQQEAPQGSTSSAVADATSASTQITLGPKSVHWYMPAPTSEDGITIAAQSAFDESNGVVQDLRNGSSLPWTMPDPGPTSSTASDGDDFLVSGETVSPQEGLQGGESSRSLRRIEGLTGEVLWEVADAGVLLASREGVVGTADQGEALLGLDPADGSVRWKQDVPEGFYALTWRSDYCQSPVAFLAPTVPGAVGSSREPINAANGEVGPKLAKAAPYRVAEGVCATKTGFVSPLEGARYGVYGTAGDLKWSFKDARELVAVTDTLIITKPNDNKDAVACQDLDGNVLWRIPYSTPYILPLAVNEQTLLIKRGTQLISIDIATGEETGYTDLASVEYLPALDYDASAHPIKDGFLVRASTDDGGGNPL